MSRLSPTLSTYHFRKLTTLSASTSTLPNQNRGISKHRRATPAVLTLNGVRHFSYLNNDRSNLLSVKPTIGYSRRRFVGWVPAVIRSVLKIRYILLGGAIGGGASLAKVGQI